MSLALSKQFFDCFRFKPIQELRVLGLLGDGRSNQAIADELALSLGTAKWHVHNILQKLAVSNRVQAGAKAHELGISR